MSEFEVKDNLEKNEKVDLSDEENSPIPSVAAVSIKF